MKHIAKQTKIVGKKQMRSLLKFESGFESLTCTCNWFTNTL